MSLSQSDVQQLALVDPDLGLRAYYLIVWMRHFGAVVRVSEGKRSAERQRELYARGRTAPGPVVTWTLQSKHVTGRAIDIDFKGYHPDEIHPAWWSLAGRIGEYLGLTWGGRWSPPDKRHFQL